MANDFSGESNLQAQYRFESGALTTDSSGKGNTLTDVNTVGVSTVDYKEGAASSDHVRASSEYFNIADANCNADYPWAAGHGGTGSFCGWVKYDSLDANAAVLAKWQVADGKRCISFALNSTPNAWIYNIGYDSGDSGYTCWTGGTPSTGRWYHIAFTFNNSSKAWTVRIWDDTAEEVIVNQSGTATYNVNLEDAVVIHGVYFDGHLDEFLVFNRILSSTEIDDIRAGTFVAVGAVTKNTRAWPLGTNIGMAFRMHP